MGQVGLWLVQDPCVGSQAGGENKGGLGVKGKILGKMELTVHGKQMCRKAQLSAKRVCPNGAGVADVAVVLKMTHGVGVF